ncbi:MAG: S-layer homology domain-containing protein, partial [Eubacteriales bacterium]
NATPKAILTNDDVVVRNLPAGLTYSVKGNSDKKTITVTLAGTAASQIKKNVELDVVVKANAVKEKKDVQDSTARKLMIWGYNINKGNGRSAERGANPNAAANTTTPATVTVKNEAAKELVKFMTDQAQANLVDKLVESVPVTDKKAAIKGLNADTKAKLAQAVLPKYTDVKAGQWYSADLAVVTAMGLVKGTSATTVSPTSNVTGQQMMAMLVRCMGKEVKEQEGANWYDAYKGEAKTLKLDEGITFDLSKDLTRAEVAAMMHQYVKLNDSAVAAADAAALAKVGDAASIPAEYKDAVAYMYQKGLLKGYEDGTFAPNKTLTRVETATILARLLAM